MEPGIGILNGETNALLPYPGLICFTIDPTMPARFQKYLLLVCVLLQIFSGQHQPNVMVNVLVTYSIIFSDTVYCGQHEIVPSSNPCSQNSLDDDTLAKLCDMQQETRVIEPVVEEAGYSFDNNGLFEFFMLF